MERKDPTGWRPALPPFLPAGISLGYMMGCLLSSIRRMVGTQPKLLGNLVLSNSLKEYKVPKEHMSAVSLHPPV